MINELGDEVESQPVFEKRATDSIYAIVDKIKKEKHGNDRHCNHSMGYRHSVLRSDIACGRSYRKQAQAVGRKYAYDIRRD